MGVVKLVLAAMQKTNDVFCSEVLQHRKFESLDRVYTRNARVFPPGTNMIKDQKSIVEYWKKTVTDLDVRSAAITTLETEMTGDSVLEIGTAQLVLADSQALAAKYVIQWKQEEGLWKWHIDIWNPTS